MIGTPIFDQTRADMPDAPLCTICGRITFAENLVKICSLCWQLSRDEPNEFVKWHCADCGEYIEDGERCQIVTERKLDHSEGYALDYTYLCDEHYRARTKQNQ